MSKMKVLVAAVGAAFAVNSAMAAGQPAFRPLIVKAIESEDGRAGATFGKEEPWVRLMRQKLGTDGPVTVTTRVVKRWREPGCARVQTEFKFHGARFDQATRALVDEGFSMDVNTCLNGQPPIETVDLRMVADGLSPEPQAGQSRVLDKPKIVMEKDGRVRAVPDAAASDRKAPSLAGK